jgi:hypothetical protein
MMRSTCSSNPRSRSPGVRIILCATALLLSAVSVSATDENFDKRGAGGFWRRPVSRDLGIESAPPAPVFRVDEAARQAAPTSQWYSTVMFHRWAYPLYAQPLTYRPTDAGFEVGLPSKEVAIEDDGRKRFIRYPHVGALVVSATNVQPTHSALAAHDDWMVTVRLADDRGQGLDATVLHGSPYSYYQVPSGDLRFHFKKTAQTLEPEDAQSLVTRIDGRLYAIYKPRSGRFERTSPTDIVLHLTDGARFAIVAGLPDERADTRALYAAHAYAMPIQTRVAWHYEEATSCVTSSFTVRTRMLEGPPQTTLMGLFPHQWSATDAAPASAPTYESVRGPIRVIASNTFTLTRTFSGLLPRWGAVTDPAMRTQVQALLNADVTTADQLFMQQGHGTYWIGKELGGIAQLAGIAEAQGRLSQRDELLGYLKNRLERWFDGQHPEHFSYDPVFATLFGFPQEFGSVTQINDHHFHYGYWLQAAAAIGLRDPAWLSDDRWGGMVRELVNDIATPERGRADYPFLRNFDPYEGHSWASGTQPFEFGNNQESSSEAVNAWAGLILLGEALQDRALRDLGIYLYTAEVASVQQYWFDLPRNVLAPELRSSFASIVFGGMYGYATWWTEEPRQIMGINLLPMTTASTYLGQDPASIERAFASLPNEVKDYQRRGITDGTDADIWQDVFAEYLALSDPVAAVQSWNPQGSKEAGNTRTHTAYWIHSLAEMGRPDFKVTADTALYGVFVQNGRRTHLAYNAGRAARSVHFSDGVTLEVPAHSLARAP